MQNEFSLNKGNAMVNFSSKYCDSSDKLLDSYGFKKVFLSYYNRIENKQSNIYKFIEENLDSSDKDEIADHVIRIFKLLTILNADDIIKMELKYEKILKDKDKFISFVEDYYSFWRKIERYTIVNSNIIGEGLQNVSFVDANNNFAKLILNTYRKIEENVLGYQPKVYRQLPAGGNAGVILHNISWPVPKEYECLKYIPFIQNIMLDPPFITYPKKNTRDGIFEECSSNPLKECVLNQENYFCYPAKVGELLAFIYFHMDFMSHGITLCNLFEMASEEEYSGKKPDIIYVYGATDNSDKIKTIFYDDKENEIMLGYVNYHEDIDYFGYMKKMTLTLHNLIMIKRGFLPIHGAMVNIVMKNGKSANIIIMGDSGAGKSESLEAFRELSEDYISDMTIIFDDMGVVKLNSQGEPLGFGTEIGAFVRLDDLDSGYAFREIDRSIFMNPDKTNARLVMPVASYKDITKGYNVDFFLYANNYEEGEELEFFNGSVEEAIKVFRDGARMAKGTTTEKGLVKSYFANPFGPVQRSEETEMLLNKYFNKFFKNGVKVGQLRTSLGIRGKEKEGPRKAALKLFEAVKELL